MHTGRLSSRQPDETTIHVGTAEDLPNIVTLHKAAFPGFFLTQLGPEFLTLYYSNVLAFDSGWVFVAKSGLGTIGFVAGFGDPARFYAQLRRRPWPWVQALILNLARRPWLIGPLAFRVASVRSRCRDQQRTSRENPPCELSSLAVHPLAQKHGTGRKLVTAFLRAARGAKASRVRLTTDAISNHAVNRFYNGLGFHLVRQYETNTHRLMNEFEYTITSTEAA